MSEIKFGTSGFRGVFADDFTKENVQKICQSIANIAQKKKLKKEICVGYDNRFMSEDFALWAAEVFAGNDFKVILMDRPTSTPVITYLTMKRKLDFGVMITASHNPYFYNGVKVFTKLGKDASLEETKEIEREIKKVREIKISKPDDKRIKRQSHVEEFVDYLISNQGIKNCQNLNVVFDPKYGSTVEEIAAEKKMVQKENNAENYQFINEKRDPFFDFKVSEPSKNNVDELRKEVLSRKANIGFALDADGDRLGVVDERGRYIDNNIILSLVYYYLTKVEKKDGDVVKTIATTSLLDVLAKKFGRKCHEVNVGFKYVSSKLIETKAIVGGESSGGLALQNHIWGKDSLISIVICLKILSFFKKPFSEIVSDMFKKADNFKKVYLETVVHYPSERRSEILDLLTKRKQTPVLKYKVKSFTFKDYVKTYYENGNWTLVRFSGTEPLLRIYTECDSEKECNQEIARWEKMISLK